MNGSQDYLPVMADCERALGRPDRALALAHNPAVANLTPDLKAEMTIVEAGARRDLGRDRRRAAHPGERAAALQDPRADWVVRLRYAYADTLTPPAAPPKPLEWFHRTVAIDAEEITDAEQRSRRARATTRAGCRRRCGARRPIDLTRRPPVSREPSGAAPGAAHIGPGRLVHSDPRQPLVHRCGDRSRGEAGPTHACRGGGRHDRWATCEKVAALSGDERDNAVRCAAG